MYHRINDGLVSSPLIIPTEKFQEQMAYIKEHCHTIGMEELCAMAASGAVEGKQGKPQVVITIDDGYRDAFQNAFPVLKALKLPATVFLATGFVGTDRKMARYETIPSPDMLSWEEVAFMQKNGITFGAHSVSHPHLPALDDQKQKEEITQSIEAVYAHTKTKASKEFFCYPYGDYNTTTMRILKELGVKIAFSVRPGVNTGEENPLELKRVGIDGTCSMDDFISNFRSN